MNAVALNGMLTRDPKMKGQGESRVCSMRLAESGGSKEHPLYIDVVAFGRQAEACGKYLAKGRHVAVVGRLRLREWKDSQGRKRSEHSIAADRIDFLPGGRKSSSSEEGNARQ